MRATFVILLFMIMPTVSKAEGCGAIYRLLTHEGSDALAMCHSTQTSFGTGKLCRWSFDYRDPSALEWAGELETRILDCVPAAVALPPEPGVNHPDTHLVQNYRIDGRRVALSVKDKAQRQQTHVFLHVLP